MYQLAAASAAVQHQQQQPHPHQPPLQPTTHAGNPLAQQLQQHPQIAVPLATSSPPIGRQAAAGAGGGHLGPQNDLGLPFKTSTRTSLHDYENMRYPVRRRRSQHSSNAASTASSRPPSDEFGRLNRESSVIDGELLKRPAAVTSVASNRSSGEGGAPDAVSLVSEVLDAEVTALTNSSPGSSNGSTERKSSSSSKKAKLQDALLQQARKNLSEELSNQELRINQTTTTTSSSGIASKNSSQSNPNQTTLSS